MRTSADCRKPKRSNSRKRRPRERELARRRSSGQGRRAAGEAAMRRRPSNALPYCSGQPWMEGTTNWHGESEFCVAGELVGARGFEPPTTCTPTDREGARHALYASIGIVKRVERVERVMA